MKNFYILVEKDVVDFRSSVGDLELTQELFQILCGQTSSAEGSIGLIRDETLALECILVVLWLFRDKFAFSDFLWTR